VELNWFDRAAFRQQLAGLECDNGHVGAMVEIALEGPHFGKIVCVEESDYIDWAQGPKSPVEQKRRRSYRMPTPLDSDFCWICNRDALMLASLGLKLEWAHKRDRAALIELGLDPQDHEQMQLCTECHRLVERLRENYHRYTGLLMAAGAVARDPAGIERPILPSAQKRGHE